MSLSETMTSWNMVSHGLAFAELGVLVTILTKIRNFDVTNDALVEDVEEIERRITSIQDWVMLLFVIAISHSVSILAMKVDNTTSVLIGAAALPVLLSIAIYLYSSNLQSMSESVNNNLKLMVILQSVILIGLHAVFYVIVMPKPNQASIQQQNQLPFQQPNQLPIQQQNQLPFQQQNQQQKLFPNIKTVRVDSNANIDRYLTPTWSNSLTEWLGGEVASPEEGSLSKDFMTISERDFNNMSEEQRMYELFQDKTFADFRYQCEEIKKYIKIYEDVHLTNNSMFLSRKDVFDKDDIRRRVAILGQTMDLIVKAMKKWINNQEVSKTFAIFASEVVVHMMGEVIMKQIETIKKFDSPSNYKTLISFVKSSPNELKSQIHNMRFVSDDYQINDSIWIVTFSRIYTVLCLILIITEYTRFEFTKEKLIHFEKELQKFMQDNSDGDFESSAKQNLFVNEQVAKTEEELIDLQNKNEDIMDQIYFAYENGFFTGIKQKIHDIKRGYERLNLTHKLLQSAADLFRPEPKIIK